jgi:hypothetical protein
VQKSAISSGLTRALFPRRVAAAVVGKNGLETGTEGSFATALGGVDGVLWLLLSSIDSKCATCAGRPNHVVHKALFSIVMIRLSSGI